MSSTPLKNPFTLKDRLKSFVYAFQGLKTVVTSQHNMWIHIVFAVLAVVLGFVCNIHPLEWIAIVLAMGMVLATEVFNSAIEALVDLVSPNFNKKAGNIKDMAAAAVLITAISAIVIGCIVFLPKLITLLNI